LTSVEMLLDRASRDAEGRRRLRSYQQLALDAGEAAVRFRETAEAWARDTACGPAAMSPDAPEARDTVDWFVFTSLCEAHKLLSEATTAVALLYAKERGGS
jgi:hypothetical protein